MENRAAAPAQRTVFENLFGPPSCLTTLGYLYGVEVGLRVTVDVGEGELGVVVVEQFEDGGRLRREVSKSVKQFVETG